MAYTLTSAIVLLFFGLIWSKSSAFNLALKAVLFGVGIWGIIVTFKA